MRKPASSMRCDFRADDTAQPAGLFRVPRLRDSLPISMSENRTISPMSPVTLTMTPFIMRTRLLLAGASCNTWSCTILFFSCFTSLIHFTCHSWHGSQACTLYGTNTSSQPSTPLPSAPQPSMRLCSATPSPLYDVQLPALRSPSHQRFALWV